MRRFLRCVFIASLLFAGGASLSGCIVAPVRGHVWVPGYWGTPHVWVGGHWRHR